MWNKFYGMPFVDYGFGFRKPFENMNCPVTNCELTNNRSRLNESELVLFHVRSLIDYFPNRTNLNQRYVHIVFESQVNCHLCATFKNIFNYTASFSLMSDYTSIYWSDSGLYWDLNENYTNTDVFSNKSEFGAALISNCGLDNTLRLKYLYALNNYTMEKSNRLVRIYGGCGEPCPVYQCKEHICINYKFYFAFENSMCKDYITEKFFDTFKYNVLIVVLGGGNYDYYMPKSAYINALDYESPQKLADYLLYLDGNKTAYNEYFIWKKYLKIHNDNKKVIGAYLCEMCIQLHLEDKLNEIKRKSLSNLDEMYGLHQTCKKPIYNMTTKNVYYLNDSSFDFSYYMS